MTDHQTYQDVSQEARDWLNSAQDKLVSCADVRGDRHSLDAKRQKIEDLLSLKPEGQARMRSVAEKAGVTSPNTAPRGQDMIRGELKSLMDDMDSWTSAVNDTSAQLGEKFVRSSMILLQDLEQRSGEVKSF